MATMKQIPHVISMRRTESLKMGLTNLAVKVAASGRAHSCLEIGSFRGEGSRILSSFFEMVVCVDPYIPYENDRAGDDYQMKRALGYMTATLKEEPRMSLLKMPGAKAYQLLSGFHWDLVYIDAKHDYVSVKQDIDMWKDRCQWIGGHDYDERFPGVRKAVNELIIDTVGLQEEEKTNLSEYLFTFSDGSWLFHISEHLKK